MSGARGPHVAIVGAGFAGLGCARALAAHEEVRIDTPGAAEHSFPLYTIEHASRLRAQIIDVFDAANHDPSLIDDGALTFVVVSAGATGTEVAGALAEMVAHTMPVEYPDLDISAARVVMIDHGAAVLGPLSEHAHAYAAGVLEERGVDIRLRTGVVEVGPAHATLSDRSRIATRTVIWGDGIAASTSWATWPTSPVPRGLPFPSSGRWPSSRAGGRPRTSSPGCPRSRRRRSGRRTRASWP